MGDKLQDLLFNISYRLTALVNEAGADDHARLMARAMSLVAGPPSGEVADADDLDLAKSYANVILGRSPGFRPAHHLQHDVIRAIFDTTARLHFIHFKAERSALWLAAQRVFDIDTTSVPSKQDDVAVRYLKAELASVTEQRDVLKRQLEELRADLDKTKLPRATITHGPFKGKSVDVIMTSGSHSRIRFNDGEEAICENAWLDTPALSQPKQVDPGGPIWVRVVDTTSKHFGLVGRLEGIEFDSKYGDEMWSVDMGGIANVRWHANVFAVVGTGRQGPGPNEAPKPDAEHQQAKNRDKWRATCLANGAKDCTVYFGPGDEVTFVVELKEGASLDSLKDVLCGAYGFDSTNCKIREVRPAFSGHNKGRD